MQQVGVVAHGAAVSVEDRAAAGDPGGDAGVDPVEVVRRAGAEGAAVEGQVGATAGALQDGRGGQGAAVQPEVGGGGEAVDLVERDGIGGERAAGEVVV